MPSTVILNARGLDTSPNHLDQSEPGGLTTASNVIIKRDNIIESRRGYKLFGTGFGTSSDRSKQLISYRDRILHHYSNVLQFQNGVDNDGEPVFTDFSTSVEETQTGLRIKSVESNGNLYFTTSEGIKKISAADGDDLTVNGITQAGGIKALDLTAELKITPNGQTGFLPQDSAVAYRVVWGTRDTNNNLVLGVPSQRTEVYNPLLNLVLQDYMRVLGALDNLDTTGSVITDGNYVDVLKLPISATADELRTNLIALSTKIDTDIIFADNDGSAGPAPLEIDTVAITSGTCTVTFINTTPGAKVSQYFSTGDSIYLSGTFTPNVSGTAATATLDLTNDITLTSVATGTARNSTTFTTQVAPAAPNPTNTILAEFTGNTSAIVCTITPNDGTNNAATPVNLTTAELRELITTGAVVGKTVTITDSSGLRALQTATGGGATNLADAGEGDGIIAVYSGGVSAGTGTLTGLQTVVGVNDTTNAITFNTTATGTISLSTDSAVYSGTFRAIEQPDEVSLPTTHDELVSLQTYLDTIITSLQGLTTESLVANDSGSGAPLNIDASACSITTGTATITFSSGDPRDYLRAGDYIVLDGFTPVSGTVDGLQTIVSVTSTTLTFTTAATGAITVGAAATINKVITFSDELATTYVDVLDITTTADVTLYITVPTDITSDYFYQVYRSSIVTASGTDVLADLTPADELQQVYEAYPTAGELSAREVIVVDITPDAFRGANLYTNAATGEGILQSNDLPPLAKDLARFKNSVFFANTKTRHRLNLNLLGVTAMIADFDLGTIPKISISDGTTSNTYSFVTGIKEITTITCVADTANSLDGDYFYLYSANDITAYYVWYSTSGGSAVDSAISGKTGIRVNIITGETAANVATKTASAIAVYNADFTTTNAVSTQVVVTNTEEGYTTDASDAGSTGFSFAFTQGRGEKITQESTLLTFPAGNTFTNSGAADYFIINSAFDRNQYYVWYQIGSSTDPAVAGRTGVQVTIASGMTNAQVAAATQAELDDLEVYTTSINSNALTVTNIDYGTTTNAVATDMPGGFTVSVLEQGAIEVLLSSNVSPSVAVDITARSFVRIINKNESESVYAFYLSGNQDVPGKMFLEGRSLSTGKFYLLANNDNTGESFNPDLSPTLTFTNTAANPTVITATAHGMVNGDQVMISGSTSTPNIDGLYNITKTGTNTFTIDVNVTSGGAGVLIRAVDAVFSANEEKKNRVYYSKPQQPEAVPLLNYLDVGSEDRAILRIFPLRDSLFVYKEDGLYRISGETAPFVLALFDSRCILLSPDSLDSCNNLIFGWTTQGILTTSESGISDPPISRIIDDQILPKAATKFVNFKTVTWGRGYESDNCYKVWTVTRNNDTVATTCYRYGTLTQSWTTYDKTNTCGIINPADDKEYLGAGDINYIEQERKEFERTDYADRQYEVTLPVNGYSGNVFNIANVDDIAIGDVIVQEQTVTPYQYNMLLKKLDYDPGVADPTYFSTLELEGGANLRTAITDLATKLDAGSLEFTNYAASVASLTGSVTSVSVTDPGVITSVGHGLLTGRYISISGNTGGNPDINGNWVVTRLTNDTFSIDVDVITGGTGGTWTTSVSDFEDILGCYNIIINKLNIDTVVSFGNYQNVEESTTVETIVNDVDYNINRITLRDTLEFVIGVFTVYKAIPCEIQYDPNTMEDPLGLKQVREATMMFENKAFTRATMSFSTDLLPEFIEVEFNGDGNGIFGMNTFGSGFFGGGSNSAPFRTYIPRQCQRCRYINVKFTHNVAREQWAIMGVTMTGEVGQSTRAYR